MPSGRLWENRGVAIPDEQRPSLSQRLEDLAWDVAKAACTTAVLYLAATVAGILPKHPLPTLAALWVVLTIVSAPFVYHTFKPGPLPSGESRALTYMVRVVSFCMQWGIVYLILAWLGGWWPY
jgi:hypothetical protein